MSSDNIQSVRGLACIFVVYFHVIGNDLSGLKLPSDSWYRYFSDLLVYIRMPLFTFLSGYVYFYRRYQNNPIAYIKGKSRRLLIPLIFVGGFFMLIQSNTPGVNKDVEFNVAAYLLFPYAHFWFLQSVFTIFLVIMFVEVFQAWNRYSFLVVFVVSILAFFYSNLATDLFSLSRTLYLMPFFMLGILVNQYGLIGIGFGFKVLIFWVLALLLGLYSSLLLDSVSPNRISVLALAIGVLGCIFLVNLKMKIGLLAYLGGFSYSIYLYHVFGTAGIRMVLNKLDSPLFVHVICGVVVGVIFPIAIHKVVARIAYARTLLLGLK